MCYCSSSSINNIMKSSFTTSTYQGFYCQNRTLRVQPTRSRQGSQSVSHFIKLGREALETGKLLVPKLDRNQPSHIKPK